MRRAAGVPAVVEAPPRAGRTARWRRPWPANSRCRPASSTTRRAGTWRPPAPPMATPALAERATRIALLADDHGSARRRRWRSGASARPDRRCCARPRRRCPCGVATWRRQAPSSKPCCATAAPTAGVMRWRRWPADPRIQRRPPACSGELVDAKAIPDVLQAWLAFGGLAQKLDQQALAERIVDEVVRRFPDEPRVALLRASQLREAGKTDEARKALDSAAMSRAGASSRHAARDRRRIRRAGRSREPPPDVMARRAAGRTQSYSVRASLLAKADDKAALQQLYDELKQRIEQAGPGAPPAARPDRRIPGAQRRSAGLVSQRARRPAALAGADARG